MLRICLPITVVSYPPFAYGSGVLEDVSLLIKDISYYNLKFMQVQGERAA